jgi:hypothetical protein
VAGSAEESLDLFVHGVPREGAPWARPQAAGETLGSTIPTHGAHVTLYTWFYCKKLFGSLFARAIFNYSQLLAY